MRKYRVRVYKRKLGFDTPAKDLIVDREVEAASEDAAYLQARDLAWDEGNRGAAYCHYRIEKVRV